MYKKNIFLSDSRLYPGRAGNKRPNKQHAHTRAAWIVHRWAENFPLEGAVTASEEQR